MKLLVPLLLYFIFPISTTAQSSTSSIYLSADGRVTTKDNAHSYVQFFKYSDLWLGKEYYIKSEVLKSEGNYRENNLSKPIGICNFYSEDGNLDNVKEYDDSHKLISTTYYYANGNKRSEVIYKDNGVVYQTEWDDTGKKIRFQSRRKLR
jgi:antitoxin component YwqK of YwqJK toxin-antitoxin module